MNRSDFIRSGLVGLSGISILPAAKAAAATEDPVKLDAGLVKEFVSAGHNDLPKVKDMLQAEPALLHASHDWGDGDFEQAIEGAGHVGNKDIARYLIGRGTRLNLFVLTMLGQSDLVLPVLKEYPALIRAAGPHGFTLLHHANVGGEDAKVIRQFLIENGLEETKSSWTEPGLDSF